MNHTNKRLMKPVLLLVLVLAAIVFGLGSSYAAIDGKKNARISFAHMGVIQNWHAEGDGAILIETVHDRWYRAEFAFPCFGLRNMEGIAFRTSPIGQLDRFSSISTRYDRCYFKSLEEIPNPFEGDTP